MKSFYGIRRIFPDDSKVSFVLVNLARFRALAVMPHTDLLRYCEVIDRIYQQSNVGYLDRLRPYNCRYFAQ